MQRIHFLGAGGNEVVHLERLQDPAVGEEQVLVVTRYAGVNPLDVLQRSGKYPVPNGASPYLPGVEVAGTVIAAGSRVTRWAVGDRVMGLVAEAGLADKVLAHQELLLAVPDTVSELAAATLPEAVITGFDALIRARTQLHDVVLIRGVNGGVGIATYKIATAMGAVPIGIARSPELLGKLANLEITAVLESEFEADAHSRNGASIIVELVGGEYVAQDLHLLASGGRVVVVSIAAGREASVSVDLLLNKRADVMGTVLRPRSTAEKALLISKVRHQIMPLVASGQLTIPVEQIFRAEDAAEAFDHLGKPGKIGKVVLDFGMPRHEY